MNMFKSVAVGNTFRFRFEGSRERGWIWKKTTTRSARLQKGKPGRRSEWVSVKAATAPIVVHSSVEVR